MSQGGSECASNVAESWISSRLSPHILRLLRLITEGSPRQHAHRASSLLSAVASRSDPIVLWDILGRLHATLFSERYECRLNASIAMESVAKHLPWEDRRRFMLDEDGDDGYWLSIDDLTPLDDDASSECLVDDKLLAILEGGRRLFASSGTQYNARSSGCHTDEQTREGCLLSNLDSTATCGDDCRASFLERRVRLQRLILARRLGLGGVLSSPVVKGGLGDIADHTITDEDLLDGKTDHSYMEQAGKIMTARERNTAKLKRRRLIHQQIQNTRNDNPELGKNEPNEEDRSEAVSSLRALLVMEMKRSFSSKTKTPSSSLLLSHCNPQTLLATDLIYHMFDPQWHVRHGALLGTLAILRSWTVHIYQSCRRTTRQCGGDSKKGEESKQMNLFGKWPSDILARCLCVLALDRFGDFSGSMFFVEDVPKDSSGLSEKATKKDLHTDTHHTQLQTSEISLRESDRDRIKSEPQVLGGAVVAPVKETAAQVLSLLLTIAPHHVQQKSIMILTRMSKYEKEWEVRHGAFLALKYVAALRTVGNNNPPNDNDQGVARCRGLDTMSTAAEPLPVASSVTMEITPSAAISNMSEASSYWGAMPFLCIQGLQDDADDVKAASAQVLSCIFTQRVGQKSTSKISFCDRGVIGKCAGPLWLAIQNIHCVSSCAVDLIQLFADSISADCSLVLHSIYSTSTPLSEYAPVDLTAMERVMQKMIEFLEFDSASVRLSCVYAIGHIARSIASSLSTTQTTPMTTLPRPELLGMYCTLLMKLFTSFFDDTVDVLIGEEELKTSGEATMTKSKANLFRDARDVAWNEVVLAVKVVLSSGGVSDFFSGGRLERVLLDTVITLLLRLAGVTRECHFGDSRLSHIGTNQVSKGRLWRLSESDSEANNNSCLFKNRLIASSALAHLCVHLNGTSDLNPFFAVASSMLLQSPWTSICEAGCLFLSALAVATENQLTNCSTNETSACRSICQSTLNAMLEVAPKCILIGDKENSNRVLTDSLVSFLCDEALCSSLERLIYGERKVLLSCLDLSRAVDNVVNSWLTIFRSMSIDIEENDNRRLSPTIASMRLSASIADVIISYGADALPAKISPLIRALMTSLKNEKSAFRVEQTCLSLGKLILLLLLDGQVESHARARDKVLDNICTMMCAEEEVSLAAKNIVRHIVTTLPPTINLDAIGSIWKRLEPLQSTDPASLGDAALIRALVLFSVVSSGLTTGSNETRNLLTTLLPTTILIACSSPRSIARQHAVQSVLNMCQSNPHDIMPLILPILYPFLENLQDDSGRLGGCSLLHSVVQALGVSVCKFVRYLLPVAMCMMTDTEKECAKISAGTFAILVRAAPLVGCESDTTKDSMMFQGASTTAMFSKQFCGTSDKVIDHLILGRALPPCRLPAQIKSCLKQSGITLRDYQRDGIAWISFLQSVRLNGALCDDMGLGKTLQSLIGIGLAHLNHESVAVTTGRTRTARSLVICPSTLVRHWTNEINRFFPNNFFKALHYAGTSRQRRWNDEFETRNIVVTSYSVLRSDVSQLCGVSWVYCILDEGHLMKNPKTATAKAARRLRSRHKLILTGTPVQNNVNELWAAFDFLIPNFLGSESDFSKRFAKDITKGQLPGASVDSMRLSMDKLKLLHQQVLPLILRREKSQVIKELPPKTITDIPCTMSSSQHELYRKFCSIPKVKHALEMLDKGLALDQDECKSSEASIKKGSLLGHDVLRSLFYLRLICTHPILVNSRLDVKFPESSNQEAPEGNKIKQKGRRKNDLSAADEQYSRLDCSGKLLTLNDLLRSAGIFHGEITAADNDESAFYFDETERNEASTTNTIFDFDSTVVNDDDDDNHHQYSSVNGSKCLIFAQFTQSLDVVEKFLFQPHMPSLRYLRLDGGIPVDDRSKLVDCFNNDETIQCMLLTTKVGGLGLNLTGASMVIFLEHDWNPYVDLQAMDRAHRIGQTKAVNVYRLVTADSIEEQIMKMQQIKLATSEAIVNSENSTMYSMGTDRLLDIFTTTPPDDQKNTESAVQDLWCEEEYWNLSVRGFLSGVNN